MHFFSFWSQVNPHWVGQYNEVGPEKVMAWAGIIGTTIIGPFFFEDSVNGESYEELLIDFVLPTLHRLGLDSNNIIYQHDGAPAHTATTVRQCLDENFFGWIGQGNGEKKIFDWPARSPDLNPLDFFLWGHLQHKVHLNDHADTEELENSIEEEITEITEEILERVKLNMAKRLRKCVEENGQLFEHLLK